MKTGTETEKEVLKLLNTLSLFPSVLVTIVIDYWTTAIFSNACSQLWDLKNVRSCGILATNEFLYLCDSSKHSSSIQAFPLASGLIQSNSTSILSYPISLTSPYAIDCSNTYLYIMDIKRFFILDLDNQEKIIHLSWALPHQDGRARGLKVDEKEKIYFTIEHSHEIFVFAKDGKQISRYGSGNYMGEMGSSHQDGLFNEPRGITVNKNYIYVCDCWNHRVQLLLVGDGSFFFTVGW